MRLLLLVPFVVGCVALSVASCGSSATRSAFPGDDDGGDLGDGGSSGTSGFVGGETGPGVGDSCSGDLRDVLDSNNHVLQTCPPDQGCAGGVCVPACASADANKSTIGCSYYVAHPDAIDGAVGGCFAAFIANTWVTPVKITVERAGQMLDIGAMARIPSGTGQAITYAPLTNGELPPGQVAIVFLSRFGSLLASCPAGVTPGFTSTAANVTGTGIGSAFHITTSAPVVAYDIYPYGGGQSAATSATLLLPTSAWDTNYVGVNAYRKSVSVPEALPFLQIVAQEDGTDVQILPVAAITGGTGVAPGAAGATAKYSLMKGQLRRGLRRCPSAAPARARARLEVRGRSLSQPVRRSGGVAAVAARRSRRRDDADLRAEHARRRPDDAEAGSGAGVLVRRAVRREESG